MDAAAPGILVQSNAQPQQAAQGGASTDPQFQELVTNLLRGTVESGADVLWAGQQAPNDQKAGDSGDGSARPDGQTVCLLGSMGVVQAMPQLAEAIDIAAPTAAVDAVRVSLPAIEDVTQIAGQTVGQANGQVVSASVKDAPAAQEDASRNGEAVSATALPAPVERTAQPRMEADPAAGTAAPRADSPPHRAASEARASEAPAPRGHVAPEPKLAGTAPDTGLSIPADARMPAQSPPNPLAEVLRQAVADSATAVQSPPNPSAQVLRQAPPDSAAEAQRQAGVSTAAQGSPDRDPAGEVYVAQAANAVQPQQAVAAFKDVPDRRSETGFSLVDRSDLPRVKSAAGTGGASESRSETGTHSMPFPDPQLATSGARHASNASAPADRTVIPTIINQIVRAAKMQVFEGGAEMTLRLNPPHLGTVQMKVAVELGTVTATLQTSAESTKQALQAGLTSLKQALADSGINVDTINVSVGGSSHQSFSTNAGTSDGWASDRGYSSGRPIRVPFVPEVGPEPASAGRQLWSSGLDYLA